jgi:hypothetical protein
MISLLFRVLPLLGALAGWSAGIQRVVPSPMPECDKFRHPQPGK